VDLFVELIDQYDACVHGRRPRLVEPEAVEQAAAAGAEEVSVRVGQSVLEEDRVHTLLERATVLDQVQPEACALLWAWSPGRPTAPKEGRIEPSAVHNVCKDVT
jgi:hypothetical protein